MTSVNYNRYNIPVPVSIFIVRQATVSELGDVLLNYMIDPKGNTADLPIHYEFIPKNSSERTDTADRYGVLLYNRSGSAKQLGMQISFYDYEDE